EAVAAHDQPGEATDDPVAVAYVRDDDLAALGVGDEAKPGLGLEQGVVGVTEQFGVVGHDARQGVVRSAHTGGSLSGSSSRYEKVWVPFDRMTHPLVRCSATEAAFDV